MRHNSVVSGHPKSTRILRVDGLSMGPSAFGASQESFLPKTCLPLLPFCHVHDSFAMKTPDVYLGQPRDLPRSLLKKPITHAHFHHVEVDLKSFNILLKIFNLVLVGSHNKTEL